MWRWAARVILVGGALLAITSARGIAGPGPSLLRTITHQDPRLAFLVVLVEEAGIPLPIPGDVWLIWAGTQIGAGRVSWLDAEVLGTLAVAIGSSILYLVCRQLGHRVLAFVEHRPRVARLLHVSPDRLHRAHDWFHRHGALAVLFGRTVPGFRIAVTVVAASFEVPYGQFILGTGVSAFVWVNAFFLAGIAVHRLGYARATQVVTQAITLRLLVVVVVALVSVAGWFAWRRRQARLRS
ncbi:MAG: DedA family protein [Candidatus Dormibacteria bacterium]